VGSEIEVVRKAVNGPCPPDFSDTFPTLDLAVCESYCVCRNPCLDELGVPIPGCFGACGDRGHTPCVNEDLTCVYIGEFAPDPVGVCLPEAAVSCETPEDCRCYPHDASEVSDIRWTCSDLGECTPYRVTSVDSYCEEDADCMLINTCCDCMVAPVGTIPPDCEDDVCATSACEEIYGIPDETDIGCWNHTCGVPAAEGKCTPGWDDCNLPGPDCQDGYYSAIVDHCWSACVSEFSCVS
jgi:hypothetical protein